jgi:hypothetical protein
LVILIIYMVNKNWSVGDSNSCIITSNFVILPFLPNFNFVPVAVNLEFLWTQDGHGK